MNAIRGILTRLLRGRRSSALLTALGVDPRRYWLLVDLFGELSDRGEMLDQLGSNHVSLKVITKLYFGFSVLLTLGLAATGMPVSRFLSAFLLFNGFIILSVLLSETGNSLINPVEGLILSHQPINGATYTAAKLTHLVMILVYLVPGLNIAPALGGLVLKDSRWWYPIEHMAAAGGVSLAVALICCAVFGWLLRFVPARRLRAVAQAVAALPLLVMVLLGRSQRVLARVDVNRWIPSSPAFHRGITLVLIGLVIAGFVGGIRALSADFLINVSGVVHGGTPVGVRRRRSLTGPLIARFFGGQTVRAGSGFVSRMMLRDWQFRRQLIPSVAPLIVFFVTAARQWRTDVFGPTFGAMHALPHLFGFILLFICFVLPYGNDYKAIWFFLTVPAGSLHGFAGGVWATLWLHLVLIPHLVLVIPLAAAWGVWHAALFAAYSLTIASIYLSLELRIVDGMPFMRQPDAAKGSVLLPIMVGGGIAAAVAVGLQYYLLFRSPAAVLAVILAGAPAAWLLTRSAINSLENSVRFSFSLATQETTAIYREIDA